MKTTNLPSLRINSIKGLGYILPEFFFLSFFFLWKNIWFTTWVCKGETFKLKSAFFHIATSWIIRSFQNVIFLKSSQKFSDLWGSSMWLWCWVFHFPSQSRTWVRLFDLMIPSILSSQFSVVKNKWPKKKKNLHINNAPYFSASQNSL